MEDRSRKSNPEASVAAFPSKQARWSCADIANGLYHRDPLAGQAFFDRYRQTVKGRVRRILGPDSECEDQVQQIFFHLVSAIGTLRDPELMDRWVNRVVINTVRKELRRRRRKWFLLYSSSVPEQECAGVQDASLLFKRTAALLDTLAPDEKTAFVLRFVMTEDLADIADMCGWSLSTTKRRIEKARSDFDKKVMRDPVLRSIKEEFSGEQ